MFCTFLVYSARKTINNNNNNGSWRGKLNTIRGTAKQEDKSLAADIHLVAYGVSKNVPGVQLSQFLATKGLKVLNCELLTKYEGARSLAYKITIKSCDLDIAQDPNTWPDKVGIRLFQFFKPQKNGMAAANSVLKPATPNTQGILQNGFNATHRNNTQSFNSMMIPPVGHQYPGNGEWTLPYPPPAHTSGMQGNIKSVWFPENPVLGRRF